MGQLGKNQVPFLLDSGSFHSLISEDLVSSFKLNFFDPPQFPHEFSLQAHNHSKVKLKDYGVILPITFSDVSGKSQTYQIPFLVELNPNSQSIIGFRDISSLYGAKADWKFVAKFISKF